MVVIPSLILAGIIETVAIRLAQKVEEEESLAEAYGELVKEDTLEDKVDSLIKEDRSASLNKLEELKKKMGLN